jgi:hypothetical protein
MAVHSMTLKNILSNSDWEARSITTLVFDQNAILSINIGASAPLAIGALISNTPKISPGDTIN